MTPWGTEFSNLSVITGNWRYYVTFDPWLPSFYFYQKYLWLNNLFFPSSNCAISVFRSYLDDHGMQHTGNGNTSLPSWLSGFPNTPFSGAGSSHHEHAPSPAFTSSSPTPFDDGSRGPHSILGFSTDPMAGSGMNFVDPNGLGGLGDLGGSGRRQRCSGGGRGEKR